MDKDAVLATLNRIMELELAGVVRYTHYALMVYGYGRIPIVSWRRTLKKDWCTHGPPASS
jgi:bacterioferritin